VEKPVTTLITDLVAKGGKPRLMVRRAELTVVVGADKGRECGFAGRNVLVGSRKGCQLFLTDSTVSRNHCELTLHAGSALLRDLDSSNGTFINGVRIREAYLEPGDTVTVGKTHIRYSVGSRSEPIELSERQSFGPIVGSSVRMREIFALLEKVAPTEATVLIQGETGTGKDLVATAIHEVSRRARGPFVVVDCAAMPPNLMEDELFGQLPLALQPKLLRVLENRTVRRLGGSDSVAVDVRLIAATNRELQREVNRNTFREDLFFRLNVIRIDLPPLRERPEDIGLLARSYVRRLLNRLPDASVDDYLPLAARETLKTYPWPGNVRELQNHIQRVVTLSDPELRPGTGAGPGAVPQSVEPEAGPESEPRLDLPFRAAKEKCVDRFERSYLKALLAEAKGNISEASRRGQMDRAHLYKLLRKHGLLEI
jgi:DNA-binding NtrC family response regulator